MNKRALGLLLVGLPVLASGKGEAEPANTIKIGYTAPFTGSAAEFGIWSGCWSRTDRAWESRRG